MSKAQKEKSTVQPGVRVEHVVSSLRQEAAEMLESIKNMKLKDPMVDKALMIQQMQGLSDFETMILLAFHSLKAFRDVQKAFTEHLHKHGNC